MHSIYYIIKQLLTCTCKGEVALLLVGGDATVDVCTVRGGDRVCGGLDVIGQGGGTNLTGVDTLKIYKINFVKIMEIVRLNFELHKLFLENFVRIL